VKYQIKYQGKLGAILNITNSVLLVEFDEDINGHSGGDRGKDRHCWNCNLDHLELINQEPNYEIY